MQSRKICLINCMKASCLGSYMFFFLVGNKLIIKKKQTSGNLRRTARIHGQGHCQDHFLILME